MIVILLQLYCHILSILSVLLLPLSAFCVTEVLELFHKEQASKSLVPQLLK